MPENFQESLDMSVLSDGLWKGPVGLGRKLRKYGELSCLKSLIMNTEELYDTWAYRIDLRRLIWKRLAILFMLALVAAILFLLASGPYTQTGQPCCSADSCKEMHK